MLYNFSAQADGDLVVADGEVVMIVSCTSRDWVKVENSNGERGNVPGNHLDPRPEFDGKVNAMRNFGCKMVLPERLSIFR